MDSTMLQLIIPLIVLHFTLVIIALIDLKRIEETKGPKWIWALIIILGNLAGPIIYFIFGRRI
ncbi:PLD nuclease N-terminal domain-containing protein [Alkalibacillus silvisoli]|uniref:PLD nuclease N-terminal domain-containing protein n=1 Tax=Alkalibacillus silvisoli TaxID=392823 RepID=A0ABP3JE49_9BACI